MTKVVSAASRSEVTVNALRKVSEASENPDPRIAEEAKNEAVVAALRSGQANLVGGTAWLWAHPDMANSVDVAITNMNT